ncbi:hypothetical protein D3C87_1624210 [compost metagenome]
MSLEFDRKFLFVETGDSHGDAIGIFTGPLDIIGRIALPLIAKVAIVEKIEKPVETDGGTVKRGKIDVTHNVLH